MLKNFINSLQKQLDQMKEVAQTVKQAPKEIVGHKILMLGGRRSGKSTILASILKSLRQTPGAICTVIDKTDYAQPIDTPQGKGVLPTLDIKQNEVKSYIKKMLPNTSFIVDMAPSYGKGSYTLEVSTGNVAIDLEFVDVPGEWMRANKNQNGEHRLLEELVESSDVFVVAIDTPFLMNEDDEDGSINAIYNRVNDITQTLLHMKISDGGLDRKQIILCPVKCERWVRNGQADLVTYKVTQAYRDLINRWVDVPEVSIRVMPIQTVGGIEADRLLPALLYFKDDDDPMGVSCSLNPITQQYMRKDGQILAKTTTSRVESDPFWLIDYLDIPLSWFRLNGAGYEPVFCEQVGYQILRFLIEKEESVIKAQAARQASIKKENGLLLKWVLSVFVPTFGVYLPVWRNVMDKLSDRGLLKDYGDGFTIVNFKI